MAYFFAVNDLQAIPNILQTFLQISARLGGKTLRMLEDLQIFRNRSRAFLMKTGLFRKPHMRPIKMCYFACRGRFRGQFRSMTLNDQLDESRAPRLLHVRIYKFFWLSEMV